MQSPRQSVVRRRGNNRCLPATEHEAAGILDRIEENARTLLHQIEDFHVGELGDPQAELPKFGSSDQGKRCAGGTLRRGAFA